MQYKHLGIFAALFFTISWVACRPNNAPKIIAIDAHGGAIAIGTVGTSITTPSQDCASL